MSLPYRGGDATQSRNGQAREGDQAESDTEAQAAGVRDTVVISREAWGFRPTPVVVSLDEMVQPLDAWEEALFRLVEAVACLVTDDGLTLLTPGDLLRAPLPRGGELSRSSPPGVGMIYQRYDAYRPTEEHSLFIPTSVRSPGEETHPTVVEVRLCMDLLTAQGMTPSDAQWDAGLGLSVDVPHGGWDHRVEHVQFRLDVDGTEDQVQIVLDATPTGPLPQGGSDGPRIQPLEPAGPHGGQGNSLARRLRIWMSLDGGVERLIALGVQGFGAVYLGSLSPRP